MTHRNTLAVSTRVTIALIELIRTSRLLMGTFCEAVIGEQSASGSGSYAVIKISRVALAMASGNVSELYSDNNLFSKAERGAWFFRQIPALARAASDATIR